ncbi:MAG: tetratricopeptide repeat protein [bacterium]|nr:tetratricopeptide repeat protein [bacterium]
MLKFVSEFIHGFRNIGEQKTLEFLNYQILRDFIFWRKIYLMNIQGFYKDSITFFKNEFVNKKGDSNFFTTLCLRKYYESLSMVGEGKYVEEKIKEELKKVPNNSKTYFEYLNILGTIFGQRGNIKEAINIYKELEGKYTGFNLMDVYNHLGICYALEGNFGKSKEYLLKYIELCRGEQKLLHLATGYVNYANLFFYENDLNTAIKYLRKAEKLNRKLNNKVALITISSNLSLFLHRTGKIQEGLAEAKKYLRVAVDLKNYRGAGILFYRIGEIQMDSFKFKTAFKTFERAVNCFKLAGEESYLSESFNELGLCFISFLKFEEARVYLQKSKEILNRINRPPRFITDYFYALSFYFSDINYCIKEMGEVFKREYLSTHDYLQLKDTFLLIYKNILNENHFPVPEEILSELANFNKIEPDRIVVKILSASRFKHFFQR